MENITSDTVLFSISVADVQLESMRILNRELNDDEILKAKDGLEWGLCTSIDLVYHAIFSEFTK